MLPCAPIYKPMLSGIAQDTVPVVLCNEAAYRHTDSAISLLQVMYARQHERQAMKDALEMAVLTTVSHPNIIQVYSCFTDMVEDAGEGRQLNAVPGFRAGCHAKVHVHADATVQHSAVITLAE